MTERESLDVSAKTVEEAIQVGLRQLNLTRDQVDVEIITEGKKGLFGLGAEDAIVRLKPKVQAAPPPLPEPQPVVSAPVEEEETFQAVTEDSEVSEDDFQLADEADFEMPGGPEAELDADVEALAKLHLENLLSLMDIRAEVTTRLGEDLVDPGDEPPLVLDITGKDLGILIGRQSETLQAIQYMVRLMISKETRSWQRVVVDVESYRARRRSSLKQMALRMAERVASSGERVVMEAMPAYDRRIIHMTLRDHPDVLTRSVGRDSNRKVTIIPK
ncbi:MAG TPA: RNA-binding cell elongation regulator Jag/EloR [Anaerolineae bacterium]|nr:RNA-binding cell elongation regulator Jag/EloR [Anaerolineae bacterium]HMR65572.1 RNA-binding cell elongation regulator Jag/EloR [Anaerolineae bacterium]